ncbi:MAG: imidazole glycerol phosphate synthase subunit HisH [Magnetospirillum sp.]|nr:imidazole glycerol phosphate synthase subunit HisH [Magnetospirillum sp.]
MRVSLLDYGSGNVASVRRAFYRLGAEVDVAFTPEALDAAQCIVIPGVGAFASSMEKMSHDGCVDALARAAFGRRIPILGICLGMQLLARGSDEFDFHAGLGWIEGAVRRLDAGRSEPLSLPHVGWAQLSAISPKLLPRNILDGRAFYFDHSFGLDINPSYTSATCVHGAEFTAVLEADNLFGTQFHPELSGSDGHAFLESFLAVASGQSEEFQ